MIGRLEEVLARRALHGWSTRSPYVAFVIMPVFAFFNAGVAVGAWRVALVSAVSLGAFVGLLVGKPLGITGFVFIAVVVADQAAGRRRLGWPWRASVCWLVWLPCRCSSQNLALTRRC
jgi:Na+/H+ antiporter NhaA